MDFAVDLLVRSKGTRQIQDLANKLKGIEGTSKKSQLGLDGVGRSASIAGRSAERAGKQIQSSFNGALGAIGKLAAAYGALRLAQSTFSAGISRIESTRRITSLAGTFNEVAQAQAAAARAAQKFGISQTEANQAFAQIYARLRPIGISMRDIESSYNGFNTAAKLSGTTASEASSAWLQLGQALGSGVLRGEELNSVFEQTPAVVQAIAKEMNAPIGQIRQLAKDGKITSDIVIRALRRIETEGADKLAEAMKGPAQQVKNLQNAFEDLQVEAADKSMPAIIAGVKLLTLTTKGLNSVLELTFGWLQDIANVDLSRLNAGLDAMLRSGLGGDYSRRIAMAEAAGLLGLAPSQKTDQLEALLREIQAAPQRQNLGGAQAQLEAVRLIGRNLRGIDANANPSLNPRLEKLQGVVMQLDKSLSATVLRLEKAAPKPDKTPPPRRTDDKDKEEKKKEKQLYDFANQNQAALAQNEIALNNQVFQNEMGLLRQRYELEQTYIEKLAALRGAGLSPGGREIFETILQFNSQQKAYEAQRRQLEEEVKAAEQAVKAAKAGVAVAGLQGMGNRVASAGGAGVPSGSAAERLLATANKNLGLFAGQSERCADAMRELYKQTGIGIGVTKKAWDGLASGGSLASSFFGSDIGQKITNIRDLRPGDLVGFERTYGNWGPGVQTHVGMYAGNGMMYDHSSKRGLVKRPLDTFAGKFMYGVRPTALGGVAGATSSGQQIAPGGQANMAGLLGAQGDVATAQAQLDGAIKRQKEFNAQEEKFKALDIPTLLAKMSQGWAEQTTQLQNQTAALQLRTRLEQEGVDPALIDGELKKLEISQKLSRQIEGLDAALQLYNETQGQAGISAEQHAEAMKTLKEGATGTAAEVERLAQATKAANDPINKLVGQWSKELGDTRGQIASLAQTVQGELASAMSSAITGLIDGTQTAEEAFSQMFKNIGKAFIDMATQMIAKALVMKALGILSGGAGSSVGFDGVVGGRGPQFYGPAFAGGGYTGDGPRSGGVDGEGGFPALLHPGETVVDHRQGNSGMTEAMRRYNAGNNVGGAGGGGAAGEGENGGGSGTTFNWTFQTTNFGGKEFVEREQLEQAMAMTRAESIKAGSELGMAKTIKKLQNSPGTRRKLGM